MAFPQPFLRRGEASPGVAPARLPEAQCFEDSGQKNKGKNIIHIYIIHICMGDIPDLQSTSHKLHIAGFYCFNSLRKIPSQGHQLWRRVRAMGRMTCLPKVLMISEQLNHGIPQKQEDIATRSG